MAHGPPHGLVLRVTHTGLIQSPLLLSDIENGLGDTQGGVKPGPVYIPVSSSVDLRYTDSVAKSLEEGTLCKWLEQQYLTVQFLSGDKLLSILALSGLYDGEETPTDIYIDNVNGDDDFGDGTSASPFASIEAAMPFVPLWTDVTINIWLAASATAYDLPRRNMKWGTVEAAKPMVRFRGDHVFAESSEYTITTDASSGDAGWVLTVSGAGWTVDEHVGKMIRMTSGARNNSVGIVYENTADTLYVAWPNKGNASGWPGVTSAGDTFVFRTCGATINFPTGNATIEGPNFWGLNVTSTSSNAILRIKDRCQFLWCNIQVGQIMTTQEGQVELRVSYIANQGSNFEREGMIAVSPGSYFRCEGPVVIDGVRATSALYASVSVYGSFWNIMGDVTFRRLGTHGVYLQGAHVFRKGEDYYANSHKAVLGFADCDTGILFNKGTGGGGVMHGVQLHNRGSGTNGITNTTYIVQAGRGANINIPSCTLTGSGGTSLVSADEGASNVAQDAFGTIVQGGSPAATGYVSV